MATSQQKVEQGKKRISGAVEPVGGTALGEEKPLVCTDKLPFMPVATFNKFSSQKLPVLSVEPRKIHMDVGAEVVDKHKPKYVPLHGKEHVKADLRKEPVG